MQTFGSQFARLRWAPGRTGREKAAPPDISRKDALDYFNSQIATAVEGWLGDRMWQVIDMIGEIFDEKRIEGHIVEFGVHHGLFLFLLTALRKNDEKCVAVDVFDQQDLNIDKSGNGSLAVFQSHLDNLIGPYKRHFQIVQRDTLSLDIGELRSLLGDRHAKCVSIDAGHTVHHVFSDLLLAQDVLQAGGIVAVDDFMSVHWPGVTEGFYRFMSTANRRLKPFLYFQNKLFLTTISEHAAFIELLRAKIEQRYPEEVRYVRWKPVEVAGDQCIAFA
jgi:cephalosporin hydroxylase